MPSFNEQHPDPLAHAIARDKFIADRARTEAIDEALYDAICDGDGRPRPDALAHHLAKHGLVIVEASKWDAAKTALMVIGSCGDPLGGKTIGTALDTAPDVARAALKKMEA